MEEHRTRLEDRPVPELLKDLSEQTTTLVRQEIELAKAEMTAKGKQVGDEMGESANPGPGPTWRVRPCQYGAFST